MSFLKNVNLTGWGKSNHPVHSVVLNIFAKWRKWYHRERESLATEFGLGEMVCSKSSSHPHLHSMCYNQESSQIGSKSSVKWKEKESPNSESSSQLKDVLARSFTNFNPHILHIPHPLILKGTMLSYASWVSGSLRSGPEDERLNTTEIYVCRQELGSGEITWQRKGIFTTQLYKL